MKILIEAVGCLTSGYLIKAIKDAGHHCVASDIHGNSAGALFADSFIDFPKIHEPTLWQIIERKLVENNIDVVIPTFDEMLSGWAERKELFNKRGISVIISPLKTINIFNDKWQTYNAFLSAGLLTPKTSLTDVYEVVKPRIGRGGVGVKFLCKEEQISFKLPKDHLSQIKVLGIEYTVDCLFDINGNIIYCVPRKRLEIKEGKSTSGIVDCREDIILAVRKLSKSYRFYGAINIQCFVCQEEIKFIEVNPRFGGGSSLGMAATENWIPVMLENYVLKQPLKVKAAVKDKLKMFRQYVDVFKQS
jgi:carbamoyl-phosphate synthase large subunit